MQSMPKLNSSLENQNQELKQTNAKLLKQLENAIPLKKFEEWKQQHTQYLHQQCNESKHQFQTDLTQKFENGSNKWKIKFLITQNKKQSSFPKQTHHLL
jgi:uncharacterized HAD superfamily protein